MPATRRLFALTTPLVAAALFAAGPAVAKGGGGGGNGGGGGGTPPPPVAVDPCAPYEAGFGVQPDGSSLGGNATRGGCVIFTASIVGGLRLVEVDALPGWTYQVKSGGNTDGRIQVDFTSATGDRASLRMEPGKTVIT